MAQALFRELDLSSSYTIYRLGLWYAIYRFIIILGLVIIYGLSSAELFVFSFNVYLTTLLIYTTINLFQLLGLCLYPTYLKGQLTGFFLVDIIGLSILTLSLNEPNFHLSLLYSVTVFCASILLPQRLALGITLFASITIIYQNFIYSLFDVTGVDNLSSSILLVILFLALYAFGQSILQRFLALSSFSFNQSQTLQGLKQINQSVLEQSETGYIVLRPNHEILNINPAACLLLGLEKASIEQHAHLKQYSLALFELLSSVQSDQQVIILQQDHPAKQVKIKIRYLTAHEPLMLLILEDLQQINQQVQQLKLAALGQLTASIAHEIRNPLAAIAHANELFLASDKTQQQTLHFLIKKQTTRINLIIENTLALARNTSTTPKKIELTRFLKQLCEEDFFDYSARINFNFSAKSVAIEFDEQHLRQILINLLRNALHHSRMNHEPVEIKLTQSTEHLFIDVIDFGEGINKCDISQLFNPFFSTEINGTGLGLYLSQSLCEANGATLCYVDTQRGACFRIQCPLKQRESGFFGEVGEKAVTGITG